MYRNIVNSLYCPKCKRDLLLKSEIEYENEVLKGYLTCKENHNWLISEGIINFEAGEQENVNNWSEMLSESDELNSEVEDGIPFNLKKGKDLTIQSIIEGIDKPEIKSVLDIATGLGSFSIEMIKVLDEDVSLICSDLSYSILKYDRDRIGKLSPHREVNYICCDAAGIPLKDSSIDAVVSLMGIQNMINSEKEGLNEAYRIAKIKLINSGIVIRDDNPKIEELNMFLKENNLDYDVKSATESFFRELHTVNGAEPVEKKIFESIGEPYPEDLIPIEGEWFAYVTETIMK